MRFRCKYVCPQCSLHRAMGHGNEEYCKYLLKHCCTRIIERQCGWEADKARGIAECGSRPHPSSMYTSINSSLSTSGRLFQLTVAAAYRARHWWLQKFSKQEGPTILHAEIVSVHSRLARIGSGDGGSLVHLESYELCLKHLPCFLVWKFKIVLFSKQNGRS